MTLRKFIGELSKIKEELQDKDIVIEAPNHLLLPPEIKFILKDRSLMLKNKKNVEKIVLTS